MGDDIETGRSTGFGVLSYTTLVEWKSKQTAIDDRPEPMSSLNLAASSTYMFDFALDTSFMDFIFIFLG